MLTFLYSIQLKDSSLLLIIMSYVIFIDSGIYYKYDTSNSWYHKIFAKLNISNNVCNTSKKIN